MSLAQRLSKALVQHHPELAANLLEEQPVKDSATVLLDFDIEHIAKVVEKLQPMTAADYLHHWPRTTAVQTLDLLEPQRAVSLLRIMNQDLRNTLLAELPEKSSGMFSRLLSYPKNSVGSHMDPRVTVLPESISVGEAMKRVRKLSSDAFYFPYVVDSNGKLTGIITVRKLMLASPEQQLGSIMHTDVMKITDRATASEVQSVPGIATFQSLPVVDSQNTFLGVLKREALVDFIESQAANEDLQLMGSVGTVCEMYMRMLTSLLSDNEKKQ